MPDSIPSAAPAAALPDPLVATLAQARKRLLPSRHLGHIQAEQEFAHDGLIQIIAHGGLRVVVQHQHRRQALDGRGKHHAARHGRDDKAQALGIDMATLNETMQSLFGVAYINDFERQGRILRVQMQAEAQTRTRPEELLTVAVRNRQGAMVQLSEIVTPRWIVGAPKLDRYNGVPALKISGNPAPGKSTGEAMAAMAGIASQMPAGVGYEWSGTSFEESLSGAQAPLLFAISMVVVFLCLAALYESWSIPFSVILVVPLGVFGALLAVHLRDLPNDVYFKVGLIAIIGLSSKNAILIIEFARELKQQGMSTLDAALEACRLRFRPILMTSIAFIVGVLPLAISSGAGANSRHAIGTGVMGGMIAATVLAVFLVPLFYLVVQRLFPGKPHRPADPHAPAAEETPHA